MGVYVTDGFVRQRQERTKRPLGFTWESEEQEGQGPISGKYSARPSADKNSFNFICPNFRCFASGGQLLLYILSYKCMFSWVSISILHASCPFTNENQKG